MFESAMGIQGWTKESELQFLYETAQTMPPGARVVEVGSWKGRSTVVLADGLRDVEGARLFAVDTFAGDAEIAADYGRVEGREIEDEFRRNTAGIDFLEVVVADSREGAGHFEDESIDWVFIDADHSYPSVRADIAAWAPKVRPGGLLSGHDYGRSGVTDAVRRVFADFGQAGSIWYTRERPRLQFVRAAKIAVRRRLR
jgi:predicted O-methyltransferase YrrM